MVLRAVATLCWMALVADHLAHGAGLLFAADTVLETFSGERIEAKYWGEANGAHVMLLFVGALAGITDIGIALATLAMGRTKLCFTALLLPAAVLAATQRRCLLAMKDDLNALHEGNMARSVPVALAMLAITLLGLACADSKSNTTKLPRSPSFIAGFLLKSVCLVQMVAAAGFFVDSAGFLEAAGASTKALSPIGAGVLELVGLRLASNMVALQVLIMWLKPTRMACALGLVQQASGVAASIVFTQQLAGRQPAFAAFFEGMAVLNAACAAAMLLAALVGSSPRTTKSKGE